MAGATLALALQHLSQGKLKVAVIEAFATDHSAHPGFDARSIALSYGTVQILQELQLWPSYSLLRLRLNISMSRISLMQG